MKVTARVFDRATHAQKRYARLKEHFAHFYDGVTYLSELASPIKDITLSAELATNCFDVSFLGMKLRFHFVACYGQDEELRGKVVVVREAPAFSECPDIVGSFLFNGQGISDFEATDGEGELDMAYSAAEIVLHFLDQSLAKPLP
jgi:hypothetical protein